MRGRGLSRFGGELKPMNRDEEYRGLEGEMSTIHDFNAREWELMGTQHNSWMEEVDNNALSRKDASKSLACTMCTKILLLSGIGPL
jgi:hypothetical protein